MTGPGDSLPPKPQKFGPLSAKGEAIVSGLLKSVALGPSTLTPIVTYNNKSRDAQAGYADNHPLIQEKKVPRSLERLRTELAKPRHSKLAEEAMKGDSFEACIGILAARLDIALDGSYEVGPLCDVLLQALKRRKPGAVQNHHLHDSRLVNAELKETADKLTLEEVADQQHVKGIREDTSNTGPYTICRTCITSFDCITERSCKQGNPAQQLGNTMKVLKETLG